MNNELSPQRYRAEGIKQGIDPHVLEHSIIAIERIQAVDKRLYPLLTLYHLSEMTGFPYGNMRKIIARKLHPYRHFYMKKKIPNRKNVRMISIPYNDLLDCQRWISKNILCYGSVHTNSYAYHPNSSPVFAAQAHVNSAWIWQERNSTINLFKL